MAKQLFTILIIEDNPFDYRLTSNILKQESKSYSIEWASMLSEGFKILETSDFDLLILDLNLPDSTGVETLTKIHSFSPEIPIIVLASKDEEDIAVTALKFGAQDYLVKGNINRSLLNRSIRYAVERKQSEKTKFAFQRLSTIIDQSVDSILIMDINGIIEYVNPAFEAVTGYLQAEILGKSQEILRSDRHKEEFYLEIWETLNRGRIWQGRMVSRKKDQSLFEEEIRISPVTDEDGQIINFVSISRDITKKKRLESIAEAANLMTNIGYIFSGIRHEIGNPINSIKMALTVLNNNMDNYSRKKIKEFTERSLAETMRVEYLLRALKSFSMFETLDVKKIRIDSFLEAFITLVKDDFNKKGIRIITDCQEGVLGYADSRALHQVLLNLFTNAADALKNNDLPIITINLKREIRLVRLEVIDNGCGMSSDEQANLFQPFYTSKADGTGLGLVIVKKMLAKMNSTIKIQSKKNQGTHVMIFIPEDNLEPDCQEETSHT